MTNELKNIAPKFLKSHSTFDTGFHNSLSPNQFFERFHTLFLYVPKVRISLLQLCISNFSQTNFYSFNVFFSIKILDSFVAYCSKFTHRINKKQPRIGDVNDLNFLFSNHLMDFKELLSNSRFNVKVYINKIGIESIKMYFLTKHG